MNLLQKIRVTTFIPFFLLAAKELSAVETEQSYKLDSIVTTGTRTPKLLKDSPVSVEVITSEQLSVLSSGTLAEALNFIPGVVLTRTTKDGYSVQMQGFSGDRVLVLLNGQRLITPTGSTTDLDQITSLSIDRIEVLRGAASVLYGSAAMGGVINIITQKIEHSKSSVGYELGSYSNNALDSDPFEHRISASMVSGDENFQNRISFQHIDKPGFKYNQENKQEIGTGNEKQFLEGDIQIATKLGDLSYRAEYLEERRHRQENDVNFGIGIASDAYFSDVSRISQTLNLNANDHLKINGNVAFHDESSGHTAGAKREAALSVAGMGAQGVVLFESAEIVSGLEYDFESMDIDEDGINNERRESVQGFTQLDLYLTDEIEILAGVRVQHDTGFGAHQAGRVSMKVENGFNNGDVARLRFGLGESYKVPTLKQRHYILDHISIGNYVVIGNQNLLPEEARTINLDLAYETAIGTSLELSAYYSEAKNLIENEETFDQNIKDEWGSTSRVFIYQNISEVDIAGGDLTIKTPVGQNQILSANYNYVEARDETNARLSNRPRHQLKLNFQSSFNWLATKVIAYAVYQADSAFPLDDVSTDANEGYLGEHKNDWVSLNLAVSQKPTANMTLRYGIQNILDEHENVEISDDYFDIREEDSRRIYLGVSYAF